MRPGALRAASVLLLLVAVALGWLAFTRFDDGEPPAAGSPAARDYEEARMQEARLSAGLGLACALSLASAFACYEWASRARPRGNDPPQP